MFVTIIACVLVMSCGFIAYKCAQHQKKKVQLELERANERFVEQASTQF